MPLNKKYLDLISSLVPIPQEDAVRDRLSELYDRVVETNEKINITSLTEPIDVSLKHIADSLSLFMLSDFKKAVVENKKICDIGCGGGFPGLPIACVAPQTPLTMIDSTEKKIIALKENAETLGLSAVNPVWGRGEELAGSKGQYRERFDVCVSRAVANLPVLCELCLPFVKKGGLFIAMKGAKAEEELQSSLRAISMLGGALKEVREINFPLDFDRENFSDEENEKITDFINAKRYLIVIEKKKPTQAQYPRKWSQMLKKTL